jgi:hypothetical protein
VRGDPLVDPALEQIDAGQGLGAARARVHRHDEVRGRAGHLDGPARVPRLDRQPGDVVEGEALVGGARHRHRRRDEQRGGRQLAVEDAADVDDGRAVGHRLTGEHGVLVERDGLVEVDEADVVLSGVQVV